MRAHHTPLAGAFLLVAACSCHDETAAPASSTSPEALPYRFTDVTQESGLGAFLQVNGGEKEKPWVLDSIGGGVALFDAENDGDLDAYLTNGGQLEGLASGSEPSDALYLNDGAGRFEDGTRAAGLGDRRWTTGVRVVDLDSDGDSEMFLTNYGPDVLYDNLGAGKFADVTERAGVGDPRWGMGAAFFDFDRDGDLDLYVGNYLEFDEQQMLRDRPRGTLDGYGKTLASGKATSSVEIMKGPMGLPYTKDRFYLNQGDAIFRDASEEVGIAVATHYSFQVLAFDAEQDGWLDVLVVNDVVEDLLWHNDEGKRFTDASLRAGVAVRQDGVAQGGMGGAIGDYDGDLVPDLWITNFYEDYSTLFRGLGKGFYSDVTTRMGLRQDTWMMVGWSGDFVDFDSDGDLELFQINGHTFPQVDQLELGTTYKQPNQMWELRDGRYVMPEGGGGPAFRLPRAGRGSALGDIDGDGDLDLLVGNIDDHPTLLRNDGPGGHWIKVLLHGSQGNRDAIGARLVLGVAGKRQLRLVGENSGFLSSNDPREHFGLGRAERAEELEVTWPDGRVERFEGLAADRLYTIQDRFPEERAELTASALGPE